jgi:hypothetical protein
MDVASPSSIVRSTCPQAAGHQLAVGDNKTRNAVSRDASKVCAASFAQILQGFFSEFVEAASGHIGLQLSIPLSGVKLGEPLTERRQLFIRQLAHCLFYFLNGAHSLRVPRLFDRTQLLLLSKDFDPQRR